MNTQLLCPHCGKPINPASLLAKQRAKTLTPQARKASAKKAWEASAAKRKVKALSPVIH